MIDQGWPDHPYAHEFAGDEPVAGPRCIVCSEMIPDGGGVVVDGDDVCRDCNNDAELDDTDPAVGAPE